MVVELVAGSLDPDRIGDEELAAPHLIDSELVPQLERRTGDSGIGWLRSPRDYQVPGGLAAISNVGIAPQPQRLRRDLRRPRRVDGRQLAPDRGPSPRVRFATGSSTGQRRVSPSWLSTTVRVAASAPGWLCDLGRGAGQAHRLSVADRERRPVSGDQGVHRGVPGRASARRGRSSPRSSPGGRAASPQGLRYRQPVRPDARDLLPVRSCQTERVAVTLRCEVFSGDLDATASFYTEVLGFEIGRDARSDESPYLSLIRGVVKLGAAERRTGTDPRARQPPTGVELVLEVVDVFAERERVANAGWPVCDEITERPWGLKDFRLLDPDGYYWRITSRA